MPPRSAQEPHADLDVVDIPSRPRRRSHRSSCEPIAPDVPSQAVPSGPSLDLPRFFRQPRTGVADRRRGTTRLTRCVVGLVLLAALLAVYSGFGNHSGSDCVRFRFVPCTLGVRLRGKVAPRTSANFALPAATRGAVREDKLPGEGAADDAAPAPPGPPPGSSMVPEGADAPDDAAPAPTRPPPGSSMVLEGGDGAALLRPSLFVIGCGRCGSTTLYQMLRQHPDIIDNVPVGNDSPWVQKELEYWGQWPLPSIDYYHAHFPVPPERLAEARGGQLRAMDASPSYSSMAVVPRRMMEAYGAEQAAQLRMMLILRNPADRFMSYYCRMLAEHPSWQWMADGMEQLGLPPTAASLGKFVRRAADHVAACEQAATADGTGFAAVKKCVWEGSAIFDVFANGLYLPQLQHWQDVGFTPSQFLVTTTADLGQQPKSVMQAVFDFAGLPTADPARPMPWESAEAAVHTNGDKAKCGRASLPAGAVSALDRFYAPHSRALAQWLREQQSTLGVRDEAIVDVETWGAGF